MSSEHQADITEIRRDGRLFAILIPSDFDMPGLSFFTPDESFLQVGSWVHPAGKDLAMHLHISNPRTVERTQEAVLVKKGRLRVFLADEQGAEVAVLDLEQGDVLVLLEGAHRYLILEDDTRVLEFKNGPFVGVESDKRSVKPPERDEVQ